MSEELKNAIIQILQFIVPAIVEDVEIEFLKEADQWRVNLKVADPEPLLGTNNEIVNSIQHYIRIAIHKKYPADRTHFILDVNLAKKQREQYITESIPKIGQEKVLQNGSSIIFVGLSSYERRIVHNIISEVKGVESVSVGTDSGRRLILRPTSETGSTGMENAQVIDINKELVALTKPSK
jgi:predicted RNA-binding protein Jag